MILFNKKVGQLLLIVCGVLYGAFLILSVLWFIIKQEAPHFEGTWANEDGSFVLDTETFTATITTEDNSETLFVAYSPGTYFNMYYPLSEGVTGVYAGDFIHTGEIYRVKIFGIDCIRVKCDDGCFEVWLKKV